MLGWTPQWWAEPPPSRPPILVRKGVKDEEKSDSIGILMVYTLSTSRLLLPPPPPPPIELEKFHLCLWLTQLVMWICSFLFTSCVDYPLVFYTLCSQNTLLCSFLFPYMFILIAQLQEWINNFNGYFLKQTWWVKDVQWMIIFALRCVL